MQENGLGNMKNVCSVTHGQDPDGHRHWFMACCSTARWGGVIIITIYKPLSLFGSVGQWLFLFPGCGLCFPRMGLWQVASLDAVT
jgi:hypothetical protein